MIAAGLAGYRPVGIDVEFESLQAARRVMKAHGVLGYVVLADLSALPFRSASFDYVFSYSAIQHVHRRKAVACVIEIERVLKNNSICRVELPVTHGLTNWRHFLRADHDEDDPESWAVRYYSWRELNRLFNEVFGSVRISCDCFFGIGVRREDIDLLPWKYKPIVILSEILKFCTRLFPPLTRLSDSVFVESRKHAGESITLPVL